MKYSTILFFALLINSFAASAQKLITLQSLNGVKQYDSPDSALFYASDGDQIFIPGGVYTFTDLKINKSVMIFGAGHFHDSTMATGETFLIGNIILSSGASTSLLTGFDIDGNISVDTIGADSVSNITISRCSFKNLYLSSSGLPPTHARNFSVYENIIHGNIYGANAIGFNCSKNFIEGRIAYLSAAVVANNDFIGLGSCPAMKSMMNNVVNTNFDNNIFLYTPPVCAGASFFDTVCTNNVFMNNLFSIYLNFPINTNSGFNNILSQPLNTIFISATGNNFLYSDNYHLKAGSPGVYAGTDGYDIGAYGTFEPFKVSSVPFNPHIQQKSIGQNTNPQGLLHIQIRVTGQEM